MESTHDLNLASKKRRVDISNPNGVADNVMYRLYFKGLVSEETTTNGGERTVACGFGVAICDDSDTPLYENKGLLNDGCEVSRKGVEIKALIHGLTKALDFGIKHIKIYCDDYSIFQYIDSRDKPKQNKILYLVEEVNRLRDKMVSSVPLMVARNDVKFAFKLAREAIASQINTLDVVQRETCLICFEETESNRMFSTAKCLHSHCFSCVNQYVEVNLLSGVSPTCLGENCKTELTLEACNDLLTPKVIKMWKQKMREDSIPLSERIYCPYPNCSMLMSKTELSDVSDQTNVKECVKCNGHFCIDCKVPSHTGLSCVDYKKLHPDPLVDDLKLKSLANDERWRQCVKCRHLIELSHGCNHMTCRCGYEFCYKCGLQWEKNQKACPSGCLLTGHGDYDDEDDDDDSSHTCEDVCECYYDEDGVRWRDFEDFVDHQPPIYDTTLYDEAMKCEYPPPEQFVDVDVEVNDDGDEYGCGCECECDYYNNEDGGFEDFYRDYYSL